ncbi:hypothetical protein ACOME3_004563 [Neoechinorhynchus agilis]
MDLVYKCLTDPDLVRMWTRGNCQQFDQQFFVLYDGNVEGQFLEKLQNECIRMKWRLRNWPHGLMSTVTIRLLDKGDHTLLELRQENVPDRFIDNCTEGWKRSYFEPIKQFIGCSTNIFA